jgi:hypothetical protein
MENNTHSNVIIGSKKKSGLPFRTMYTENRRKKEIITRRINDISTLFRKTIFIEANTVIKIRAYLAKGISSFLMIMQRIVSKSSKMFLKLFPRDCI